MNLWYFVTVLFLAVSLNAKEIVKEEVRYCKKVDGLYFHHKKEKVYPGIVLIHDSQGLTESVERVARELVKKDFDVLAVDLGPIDKDFNEQEAIQNMQAAVRFLRKKGSQKIASMGWGFGGEQSLELSLSGEKLDATVIFYAPKLEDDKTKLSSIKWPVLGIFGDEDGWISQDSIARFHAGLGDLGITNEIYLFVPGNYHEDKAKAALEITIKFLKKYLKS